MTLKFSLSPLFLVLLKYFSGRNVPSRVLLNRDFLIFVRFYCSASLTPYVHDAAWRCLVFSCMATPESLDHVDERPATRPENIRKNYKGCAMPPLLLYFFEGAFVNLTALPTDGKVCFELSIDRQF
jgi:hypothetical protein